MTTPAEIRASIGRVIGERKGGMDEYLSHLEETQPREFAKLFAKLIPNAVEVSIDVGHQQRLSDALDAHRARVAQSVVTTIETTARTEDEDD